MKPSKAVRFSAEGVTASEEQEREYVDVTAPACFQSFLLYKFWAHNATAFHLFSVAMSRLILEEGICRTLMTSSTFQVSSSFQSVSRETARAVSSILAQSSLPRRYGCKRRACCSKSKFCTVRCGSGSKQEQSVELKW